MATKLFLLNIAGTTQHWGGSEAGLSESTVRPTVGTASDGGWRTQTIKPTPGSGATTLTRTTVGGPTNGIEFKRTDSDGAIGWMQWISEPIDSGGTLTNGSTISCNLWGFESAAGANAALNLVLEKYSHLDGSYTLIGKSANTTELPLANAAQAFNITVVANVVLVKGDRIRARVFLDDGGTAGSTSPTFVASGNINAIAGGNASTAIAAPAGLAIGDYELLQIIIRDGTTTMTTPTGWTLVAGPTVRSGAATYYWFERFNDGSGDPTPSLSSNASDRYAMRSAYRNTTGREATSAVFTATTAGVTITGGITTLSANARVVCSTSGEDNSAASVAYTATSPATLTADNYQESTTGADGAVAIGSALKAAAGATGNITATWSATVVGEAAIAFALAPQQGNVMAGGFTCTFSYNGTTAGAAGDSYFTLPIDITFVGIPTTTTALSGNKEYLADHFAPGGGSSFGLYIQDYIGPPGNQLSAQTQYFAVNGPTSGVEMFTEPGWGSPSPFTTDYLPSAATLKGPVYVGLSQRNVIQTIKAIGGHCLIEYELPSAPGTWVSWAGANLSPLHAFDRANFRACTDLNHFTGEYYANYWVVGPDVALPAGSRIRVRLFMDDSYRDMIQFYPGTATQVGMIVDYQFSYFGGGSPSPPSVIYFPNIFQRQLEQLAYEARNDDGSETSATWKAPVNTPWTQDVDQLFRLRIAVQEVGNVSLPINSYDNFKLQANVNGTGWFDVTGTSTKIRIVDTLNFADDASTTQQITTPSANYVAGRTDDDDGATGIIELQSDHITELEFSLIARSADGMVTGDVVHFRVERLETVFTTVFPSTPILDNFNRSDQRLGNPLPAGPQSDWEPSWVMVGSPQSNLWVRGNGVALVSGFLPGSTNDKTGALYFPAGSLGDQEAYLTIARNDFYTIGVGLRLVHPFAFNGRQWPDGYWATVTIADVGSGPTVQWLRYWSVTGGAISQMGGNNVLPNIPKSGDVFGARAIGSSPTTITAYINGVVVGSQSTTGFTNYATGYIGMTIGMQTYAGYDTRTADDFGGGGFSYLPLNIYYADPTMTIGGVSSIFWFYKNGAWHQVGDSANTHELYIYKGGSWQQQKSSTVNKLYGQRGGSWLT